MRPTRPENRPTDDREETPTAATSDAPERPADPSGLSRRRFFAAGGGAAAALALTPGKALAHEEALAEEAAEPLSRATAASTLRGSTGDGWYQPFCEPPTERSQYGTLDTRLHVVPAQISIREKDGLRVEQTRTYNGIVPGPTLRVKPGDRMNILLDNQLPPNPDIVCPPPDPNEPHCFNTTNLHTHGLHVSPLPPSDDIFLRLEPGLSTDICIDIPDFHAPGTYWYHAHKHGSTAIQLVNGLAGALIIEDPPSVGPVERGRDVVMVMQEIIGEQAAEILYGPDLDGRVIPGSGGDHADGEEVDAPSDVYNCMGGAPCSIHDFTINGCLEPTLNLRPGEVQRWRLINATGTPRGYTKLRVDALTPTTSRPEIYVIAVDGIYLTVPRKFTDWLLVPGGRVDLAVRFPAGSFQLVREPTQGGACADQVLVHVNVSGSPLPIAANFPGSPPPLPDYLAPITDTEWQEHGAVTRELTFDITGAGDPNVPCSQRFLIDGQSYDRSRIDHDPKLGTVEKWIITNTSPASHPFHIHVNPFQVIAIGESEIPLGKRFWQDTVDLPPGETVTFYTRFLTFHGKFVLHCHILNHEDWGMMQNVEVEGDGVGPCTPVPVAAGQRHTARAPKRPARAGAERSE